MRRRSLPLVLVVAVSLHATNPVLAQDVECIDRLSDAEVSYRLSFIEHRFDEGKGAIRGWWWTFLAYGAAATTLAWIQFSRAPHGDDPQTPVVEHGDRLKRESRFITAVGASIILAQLGIGAPMAAFAPRKLRRLPAGTPEQRRSKLRVAQRLLEQAALRERAVTRPFVHGGPLAWSLAMGTYLAARFHGEGSRATWPIFFAYASPLVATEVRVLTQPRQAFFDWERYRGFACTGLYAPPPDVEGAIRDATRDVTPSRSPSRARIEVRPIVGPLYLAVQASF